MYAKNGKLPKLHCSLTATPRETHTNICKCIIFLETRLSSLQFPTNHIGLSSLKFFWWALEFLFTSARGRFGHSRSSKVDKFGANRKRICDFLLVHNSNFGPILHRFWATTCFMCSWPHPYSTLILGVFPLTRSPMLGVNECMGLKLFRREIIFEEFRPIWSQYLIVTDGRTPCNLITALCVASRGKNRKKYAYTICTKPHIFPTLGPISPDSCRVVGKMRNAESWWHSIVVKTAGSGGVLSLSCTRLTAGRVTTLCVKRPLSVSQQGRLRLPSLRGR